MTLPAIESQLRAAGLDPVRTFGSADGWSIAVRGEIVARGQSIGELKAELERWVVRRPGTRSE